MRVTRSGLITIRIEFKNLSLMTVCGDLGKHQAIAMGQPYEIGLDILAVTTDPQFRIVSLRRHDSHIQSLTIATMSLETNPLRIGRPAEIVFDIAKR